MAKVELKQPIVEAIAEEIKDAQSVVLGSEKPALYTRYTRTQ